MFLAVLGAALLFVGAVILIAVHFDEAVRWYGRFLIVAGLVFVILPLFWGCASSRTGTALNVAVIGSGVSDYASTRYAIAHGGREANPILSQGAVRQAVVKTAGIGAVIGLAHVLDEKHRVLAHVMRAMTVIVWSAATWHNARQF